MNSYPEDVLQRLQSTLLEMLDIIARVCEDNDITWFLEGGSALGAVRHNAIIPWDDDIDIGMLKPDYERFLAIAPNKLPQGYKLHTPQSTQHYAAMFSKVSKTDTRFITQELRDAGLEMGIAIDIFPYDPVSADKATREAQYRHARRYTRMSYLYHSRHISRQFTGVAKPLATAAFAAAHTVLHATTNEAKLLKNYQRGTHLEDGAPMCGYTTFSLPYYKPLPKEAYAPTTLMMFSGKMRPVPGQFETYLGNHFGDWRILPPVEQRKNHAPVVLDFGDGINVLES